MPHSTDGAVFTPSPVQPQPRIAIIGAGVGGLTTALQLHARGFQDIHLFEASSTLTTLGVGINVQPSAVLILRNLGLLPTLGETGVETQELNFYDRHGNAILSEPRGKSAGYAVPQFSIHRGELQMLLLDTVKARLGDERVKLGHALASFEQDEKSVTAKFIRRRDPGRPCEVPQFTAEVVIAADGINSEVRKVFYPQEGPPHFSGRMLWRGCLEREPYLTGASMVWSGHANQKFIAYPISAHSQARGKSLVNWIAELRIRSEDDPDTTPPEKADWTLTVPKERFAGEFASWTFGFLDVPQLIAATEKVYEFPMCDRDPVNRWSFGRVTLLGDAAHPMYPIGSNGASQAILDAECIAAALLASPTSVQMALQSYQETRLPPTSRIIMANRGNGPDQVLQVAHERAPDGFKDVRDIISPEELAGIGKAYKAVAGFELEAVNKKAAETRVLV